jgi:phosphoribosyl-ATP pyrophosphohydrolase/phosphoribosyl-AMP cyclohydrolase
LASSNSFSLADPSTSGYEDSKLTNAELSFIAKLETIITDRLQNPTENSYTSSLAKQGAKRVAQKVGEEAVELALASVAGDRTETINEAADLMYHLLVLLNNQGIKLADVVATLETRHAP